MVARNTQAPKVVPHGRGARIIGIDSKWLEDEVKAGRLPGVIAGSRVLVNVEAVEAALAAQASRPPSGADVLAEVVSAVADVAASHLRNADGGDIRC